MTILFCFVSDGIEQGLGMTDKVNSSPIVAYPYVAERILYDALCIGTRQTVSVIAGCDTGKDGLCWRGERILE